MDARLIPLATILDLNTDLLLNSLDGISEEESHRRLGHPLANPLARYLADAKTIDEIRAWATLDQLRSAWVAVSAHLLSVLDSLTSEELDRPNSHRFPISDTTQLGLIAYLSEHDSYHLGQVAFIRRQLGKPAMTYTRGTRNNIPIAAV